MKIDISVQGYEYPVIIGRGIISSFGVYLPLNAKTRCVLVSDKTVNALYGDTVMASLGKACLGRYVIKEGEAGKNWDELEHLLGFFAETGLTRADIVIALGGGVVGDLAGFAAAIFSRGCPLVHIPTTLSAMTDSSIGGKTGINFLGKNTVGAFHHPLGVFADPACLKTLPRREYASGMAEVIKHAFISSAPLYNELVKADSTAMLAEEVLAESIGIKRDIIQRDPFEAGERRKLNFGHTLAHVLESALGYGRLRHGEAVAIGMMAAAKLGELIGETRPDTAKSLAGLLARYGLPLTPPEKIELGQSLLADKKRKGETLHFVILREIGAAAQIELPLRDAALLLKKANPWLL